MKSNQIGNIAKKKDGSNKSTDFIIRLFRTLNACSSSFSFASTILTSCASCHCCIFFFAYLFSVFVVISCSLFHLNLPFYVAVANLFFFLCPRSALNRNMYEIKATATKPTLLQFNYKCYKERPTQNTHGNVKIFEQTKWA